jgi:hypothetical protein|tara:strand:+ start:111 stop:296 length:186 start_codon:yes stop_codon:yes gene_type:complete
MEIIMNQPWYAIAAEIVMFANTVTMAMPTRWRDNNLMNYVSKGLNFLALNIFKNRNMDDIP